jgi:hypothetical protein
MEAVVADVAQPHQRYGVQEREAGVTVDTAVAQLRDERDQDGKRQAVHFIEKDDQRAVDGGAIAREGALEDISGVVGTGEGLCEEVFAGEGGVLQDEIEASQKA